MATTTRQPTSPVCALAAAALSCCVLGSAFVAVASDGPVQGTAAEPGRVHPLPVDVFFVLDNSGSMRTNDPEWATWQIVTDFAVAMPEGGRLGVVVFDDGARLVEPLSAEVGRGTGPRWMAVMGHLDYSGQRTHSPSGIERALYELKRNGREQAQRVVVLVTDGIVDTGDVRRDLEKTRWLKEDLAAEASQAGVRIYGIAFSESADVELIQALALATGGEYWRVERAGDIANVLADVRGRVAEASTVASPVGPPPPAVASSPPGPLSGWLLLTLGLGVGAVAIGLPLFERGRRRARLRVSAFATPDAVPLALPPLPVLPRGGRPPVFEIVDESDAMGQDHAVLLLEGPSTRIGRDPGCDVPLPNDAVSSFHASIDYRDGYFYLEDRRSTNGTSLNGQRLPASQPVQLKSGDGIGVAGSTLRFLIPDHEPQGRTAALGGTALPSEPESEATELHPAPGDDAGAGDESPARMVAAFDRCLAAHLTKIEGLGEAQRRFIERGFPLEVRAMLARRAHELIEACLREGQGDQVDVSRGDVHYTICAVPGAMSTARSWFDARHGGYAKFLVGLLDAWATAAHGCDAVCVITFGLVETPWLSITILPARDDAEAVEVMSYEFLSEDDRRRALDLEIVDVTDLGRR